KAKERGEYFMPGVTTPGSKYKVNIMQPGGTKTGKTLPLDRENIIYLEGNQYLTSIIDVVNPFIYLDFNSFNFDVTLEWNQISRDNKLINKLNEIRDTVATKLKFSESVEIAHSSSPAIPKIALVTKP